MILQSPVQATEPSIQAGLVTVPARLRSLVDRLHPSVDAEPDAAIAAGVTAGAVQ